MAKIEITREIQKCIDKTVNYILKDLQGDLTLGNLASIANYSPFHYQRLFRQVIGESPKQYVIRMRLETAAHFLIIHKNKPIQVVASECGFSSPAVFARAFKNLFDLTAEEFRVTPHRRQITTHKNNHHFKRLLSHHKQVKGKKGTALSITVKTLPVQHGVCINSEFDSAEKAHNAIKELVVTAKAHDLFTTKTKIMGIMYPHHNIYRAFISVEQSTSVPLVFNRAEIKGGKFAVFTVKGPIAGVFHQLTQFYQNWLPANGYKVADIYGFEVFTQNPLIKAYDGIEREIHVPIEPL